MHRTTLKELRGKYLIQKLRLSSVRSGAVCLWRQQLVQLRLSPRPAPYWDTTAGTTRPGRQLQPIRRLAVWQFGICQRFKRSAVVAAGDENLVDRRTGAAAPSVHTADSAPPQLSSTRHWLRTILRWCGIILADEGDGSFSRAK